MQFERSLALLHRAAHEHRHVIVAVSGGADSMLLLHLACEALTTVPEARLTAWYLHHYQHALEPEREAALNACVAHCLNILPGRFHLQVDHADLDRIQKYLGTSWEHAASMTRRRRLLLLTRKTTELLQVKSIVATGHNYSDFLETVILRSERKIPASALPRASELDPVTGFLRPLTFSTRDDVRQEARARHITWFEDASNDDMRIARNRVRHSSGLGRVLNPILPIDSSNADKDTLGQQLKYIHGHELQYPYEAYLQLTPEKRAQLLFVAFRRLAICTRFTRNHYSRAASLPFFLPPFFAHYESRGNTEVIVFRRGLGETLRLISAGTHNYVRGDRITRSTRIKTSYGHKSVAKMFSERKLSPRQRRQTLVCLSDSSASLAEHIDFSPDIKQ